MSGARPDRVSGRWTASRGAMRRKLPLVLPLLLLVAPVRAADEPPLEARVNVAIDRGAASLVRRQAEDGSWQKEDAVHPLGRTALCTFALLHAGYPPDHPAVRKALAFLGIQAGYAADLTPHSTYEAACLVLLMNALGKGHERTIRGVCQWLCDHFNSGVGLWGYPDGIPDLSNTQYAALALKAGARHGFEAPRSVWKRLVDAVLWLQAEDGAFRYRPGTIYRATMTHSALLVLKFAHEALGTRPPRKVQEAMDRGHRWLVEHFDVERTPFGRGWQKGSYYYYMYGLERYAQFFELERIGDHDWYREGAEVLLDRQEENGAWGNLEETCFAILFLRRATLTEPEVRAPVLDPNPAPAARKKPDPPRPAEDAPFLRTWLVAGPFPGTKEEDDHLFVDHLDVRRQVPRDGGPAGKRRWELYASPEDKVEFDKALLGSAWASFFAATWLHVEEDVDAVLWLASDDGLRAYLDGDEILFGNHRDYCGDDFYRVPVKLAKGRHLVLLWVCNLEYDCYFRARLTDPDGKPIAGVTASPSPRR